MPTLRAVVRGRVQGVGFRWFVREHARGLGVKGWVRNHADGSVEVAAEGDAASLDRLRECLARGPTGARVAAVDDLPRPANGDELPFPFAIIR
jgi:acylphosphatase